MGIVSCCQFIVKLIHIFHGINRRIFVCKKKVIVRKGVKILFVLEVSKCNGKDVHFVCVETVVVNTIILMLS